MEINKNLKSKEILLSFCLVIIITVIPIYTVSGITKTYGPPYYKFYYAASNLGLPWVMNWAECWTSDTNVYGANVHVGHNFATRRFVQLGVGKDITVSVSKTSNLVADFRISGYLYAWAAGDARLQICIGLDRWVSTWWGGYWSLVGSWVAVNYYVEYGGRMSFSGSNIHFTGPDFSLTPGTYRLFFNVYVESSSGYFCRNSREKDEPGKIYFDSIGYEYESSGCPILSVFNGEEYIEEGLLDIHNPDGIDVIYEHTLLTNPVPINNRYHLRLTEHNKTISHIDKVELWGELTNGEMKKLYLVSAMHSKLDQVRRELWFSDDKRVDQFGADHNGGISEFIDLEFYVPRQANFDKFIFTIEGNNIILK